MAIRLMAIYVDGYKTMMAIYVDGYKTLMAIYVDGYKTDGYLDLWL